MSQANSFGTVFLYGVGGRVANAAVQSFKDGAETKNNASTDNEDGNEIERRYDDKHHDATIEIKIRSTYTIPEPASILSYEGQSWEVVKVERVESCKAHKMVTLAIKRSEYIDSSSSTATTHTS